MGGEDDDREEEKLFSGMDEEEWNLRMGSGIESEHTHKIVEKRRFQLNDFVDLIFSNPLEF